MNYPSISNARLKLAKNQANVKQHPEAELLVFENYSHYSSTLSSKNDRTCSKKIIQRSTDSPGSRHGHKYSKDKKCLSMYVLSNAEATFEAQFMKS